MTSKRKNKLPQEKNILPEGGAEPAPAPARKAGKAAGAVSLAQPGSAQAERPSLTIMEIEFYRSQKPPADRRTICPHCKYDGKLGDCEERQMGEKANGWSWHCPACGGVVYVYAFVL